MVPMEFLGSMVPQDRAESRAGLDPQGPLAHVGMTVKMVMLGQEANKVLLASTASVFLE